MAGGFGAMIKTGAVLGVVIALQFMLTPMLANVASDAGVMNWNSTSAQAHTERDNAKPLILFLWLAIDGGILVWGFKFASRKQVDAEQSDDWLS